VRCLTRWFIFVLVFFWSCSPPLLAQEPPLRSSIILPPAQSSPSNPQESSWTTLDELLNELETSATALNSDSKKLLSKLRESETQVTELSSLLGQSEKSLRDCEASLQAALYQIRARSSELWLWRGASALLAIGCVGAVLWGFGR
jgi:septal ring factor EnvC (AmiA/AmiB activator)